MAPDTPPTDPTSDVSRPGGTAALGTHTVSRVGYGGMQLERLHDDRPTAISLLRKAFDLGVDHVDTAEFYGDGVVNGLLAEALRPEDTVVVVSKVGADPNPGGPIPLRPAQRPEQLRASVEANLRTLGTDQVPVVNLRRLDTGPGLRAEGDQVVDLDDQLAVMTALRDEGKIGAIGLSSVTLEILQRALPAGIVCVQNAYSLVARSDEPLLELCAAEGIAWVPYFPLGSAFPGLPKVTDDPAVVAAAGELGCSAAQVGLAWLLTHSPGTLLIPGTADVDHLEANLAAGDLALTGFSTLSASALAALDAVASRPTDVPLR